MANAILAYGNQIDGATLTGGSWVSTLPLANLQDRTLGRVARSTGVLTTQTQFDIDFGGTRLLRVFALVAHNFSIAARYRFRFATDPAFSTVVLDTGWTDVWPVVYPLGTVPWGSPSWWTGKYSAEEIEGYTASCTYIFASATNARYVRVEIDDTTNEDGFVEIGRVFAGNGFQPARNMTYGASIGWENRTEVQEALSGAEYFNERRAFRVVRFGLAAMTEDEAMANASELIRAIGVSREVFFVWDPDDTTHALRRQFLGRLRTLNPIENAGPDRWKAPFEVKELL